MGLVFSLAEALNVGWGVVAGEGATGIKDKLNEQLFRRSVVKTLAATEIGVDSSAARRVIRSDEFIEWISDGGTSPLDGYLTDEQMAAFGVPDESTAVEIGEAIGQALGAVAFGLADPVHQEVFRRFGHVDEATLGTFNYVKDIWELLVAGQRQETDVLPVRWNERPVTAFFTGRHEDLEAIEVAVGSGSTTVVTQLVGGLGGVGKTQLVAKYVAEHRDEFDLVAWFDASTEVSSQLAGLAARVGLAGAPDEMAGAMLGWLAATDRKCLVVLDNVEDDQTCWPGSPPPARCG